jgi:hypothetical protein
VAEQSRIPFEERRAKENLAFLVVKFLKAYVAFDRIHAAFRAHGSAGLLEPVRELEETLAFDLKEIAHGLFRARVAGAAPAPTPAPKPAARVSRRMFREVKASIEMRAIDSYIGTGYHLLAILKESLYQLRHYVPAQDAEKSEVSAIEEAARKAHYTFSPEEARELENLRSLAALSRTLGAETEATTRRMIARCRDLFQGTAQVILSHLEGAAENEVLVQNLLQNHALLEQVYGRGSAERIFSELCRGREAAGSTGLERAQSYVRKHCGNTDGLTIAPGEGGAAPGPAA